VSPLHGTVAEVPPAVLDRLAALGPLETAPDAVAAVSRDWWPLAMIWEQDGTQVTPPAAVVGPTTADGVAAVLRVCNEARVPVTAAAGRSGVCGASMPVHGGVVLDLTALTGIVDVDDTALVLDVRAGTFGTPLEATLRRDHHVTLGHWPQSIDLSTVGGWLACRSAGQMSTRYGKIEDMVAGLDVVLADGRVVHTGGAPRAAVGPDLTQLFVGSEGTLGVITGARLRVHPKPPATWRRAWSFASFDAGLQACRRTMQRGATPAVLRLYDATEAERSFGIAGCALLLALDEGDTQLIGATQAVVGQECAQGTELDDALVEQWLRDRNDVGALHEAIDQGLVVDTMEVAGAWADLPSIYDRSLAALREIEGMVAASAHQSHAYTDGACLYFTFAGLPAEGDREAFYVRAWDAAQRAALASGASLSHHHGVGMNRARFVREALGERALAVLQSMKDALDPVGVLNPGKLGLRSPLGDVRWP
jgi:alkyldihydroxyacetonephosphate synthase